MAESFARHLRASNLSPKTISIYGEATGQLSAFLHDRGMPTDVGAIHREHVEMFITDLLERSKPATASNRFRALQRFFKFLVEEGEIRESPMARMRPPIVPEQPTDVLRLHEVRALLKVSEGPTSRIAATPHSSPCSTTLERGSRRYGGCCTDRTMS
jgi:site-specific recombinase XerD